MDAATKIAKQRLSVLELAEISGNVSEACRRRDMTRTQFYEYERRFQTHGLEGLKDLSSIHKSHPQTTPKEVVKRILDLALQYPSWGCNCLEGLLKAEGINISNVTIQKIFVKHQMGTRYERWLALERKYAKEHIKHNKEQIAFIEKQNPAFKEQHNKSSHPGDLLSQDTFYVGHLKGVGKVYLHGVVDTYSSLAFRFLHTSKQPEAAVSMLHIDVLPFYKEYGFSVKDVLTNKRTEFCGNKEDIRTKPIWSLTISNTNAQKYPHRKPTSLMNDSIVRCLTSSFVSSSVLRYTILLNRFKRFWTSGLSFPTPNVLI